MLRILIFAVIFVEWNGIFFCHPLFTHFRIAVAYDGHVDKELNQNLFFFKMKYVFVNVLHLVEPFLLLCLVEIAQEQEKP